MRTSLPFLMIGAAVMAGCSTLPPLQNPALSTAHAIYQAAAADPQILRSAPVELARAREHLNRAETAWQNGEDSVRVNHLAYLATQQALIANEQARLTEARQNIETASAERSQVLLEAQRQALANERLRLALAQDRARAAEGVAAIQAERAAQLQQDLQELAARQTPVGMVITLGDVLFDVGKATLKSGAARSLERLAEFMTRHPERNVRIEGFTDDTGSAETNQELSLQRAEAVRQALADRGIARERILVAGYGSGFPVASNDTPAGRQQNRRVEIVISDEAGNIAKR